MTPTPIDLDVAIIGGGPGGLATALALTRAVKGTRVKVLFRTLSSIVVKIADLKYLSNYIAPSGSCNHHSSSIGLFATLVNL